MAWANKVDHSGVQVQLVQPREEAADCKIVATALSLSNIEAELVGDPCSHDGVVFHAALAVCADICVVTCYRSQDLSICCRVICHLQ